jgi:hypothetical protein
MNLAKGLRSTFESERPTSLSVKEWLSYPSIAAGVLSFALGQLSNGLSPTILSALLGMASAIGFRLVTGRPYDFLAVMIISISTIGGFGIAVIWVTGTIQDMIIVAAWGFIFGGIYMAVRYWPSNTSDSGLDWRQKITGLISAIYERNEANHVAVLRYVILCGTWGTIALILTAFLDMVDRTDFACAEVFLLVSWIGFGLARLP